MNKQEQWDQAGKQWWNRLTVERRQEMLQSSKVEEIDSAKWKTPAGSAARCYEVFGEPHPV